MLGGLIAHAAADIEDDKPFRGFAAAAEGQDRPRQCQDEQRQKRGAQQEEQDLMPLDPPGHAMLTVAQPAQTAEGHLPHATRLEDVQQHGNPQQRQAEQGKGVE